MKRDESMSDTFNLNLCLSCMKELGEGTICPHCGTNQNEIENPEATLRPASLLYGRYLVGKVIEQEYDNVNYIGYDLMNQKTVVIQEKTNSDTFEKEYCFMPCGEEAEKVPEKEPSQPIIEKINGNKKIKIKYVLLAVIAALIVVIVSLWGQISHLQEETLNLRDMVFDLKAEKADLEEQNESLQAQVVASEEEARSLAEEMGALNEEVEFVDKYVVFVEDDDTNLYHKFHCSKFLGNSFWVYNINLAQSKDLQPCSLCYGE